MPSGTASTQRETCSGEKMFKELDAEEIAGTRQFLERLLINLDEIENTAGEDHTDT